MAFNVDEYRRLRAMGAESPSDDTIRSLVIAAGGGPGGIVSYGGSRFLAVVNDDGLPVEMVYLGRYCQTEDRRVG